MTYKRLRIVTIIAFLLLFSIANASGNAESTLTNAQLLVNQIGSGDENEFYTAILLLSHVALEDDIINQLSDLLKKEKNPTKKLYLTYTLSIRTQEPQYKKYFIKLYPTGMFQQDLWRLSRRLDYVSITSPLQSRLAIFAYEDDKAFKKLLSGYDFADGADLTVLFSQIYNLCEASSANSYTVKNKYPKIFRMLQELYPGQFK